jgi:non-ribosomal peptide synthetase component F
MWVGGAGVSKGYINLPDLTSTRYKHDKFMKDGCVFEYRYFGTVCLLDSDL